MSEDAEHLIVARYLDLLGVLWCHVPNGGHRTITTAKRFKRMGVKAGVPDFLLFDVPPKATHYRGVAIELKAAKGRLRPVQRQWLEALQSAGWLAKVAFGATDAIGIVRECGYSRRR